MDRHDREMDLLEQRQNVIIGELVEHLDQWCQIATMNNWGFDQTFTHFRMEA